MSTNAGIVSDAMKYVELKQPLSYCIANDQLISDYKLVPYVTNFRGTVREIVDGDTLDITNVRLRLALVNTPETRYLRRLLQHQRICFSQLDSKIRMLMGITKYFRIF